MSAEPEPTQEVVNDPEAHARSEEAARYRTERNAAREELKTARLEAALYRANNSLEDPFTDPAVALRLLDPAALSWGKDGAPTGVREALERLAEDYPALLRSGRAEPQPQAPSAGMTGNKTRDSGSNLDLAKLRRQYPILGRNARS